MKAYQLLRDLIALSGTQVKDTCDTLKAGCPEKEVKKCAVCFIATAEVLEKAKEWGADALITHEPTFYNHPDRLSDEELTREKLAAVEASGLTVMRFHDHMHRSDPDLIHKGFMDALGIGYHFPAKNFVTLDEARTPLELAQLIKGKLGLGCVRLCGNADFKTTSLSLSLGECSSDDSLARLQNHEAEVIIAGEICEWRVCEYVRDAALFGKRMAVLTLGHEGSERDGMKALCGVLADRDPEIEFAYFESGEVYRYI